MIDAKNLKEAYETLGELSKQQITAMDNVHFLRAKVMSNLNMNENAFIELKILIHKYPESEFRDEALLNQGYLLIEMDKLSEAREYFRLFMEEFPDHKRCEKTLSDVILLDIKLSDDRGAIENSKIFISKFPDGASTQKIHERLAALLTDVKDYASSVAVLKDHLNRFKLNEQDEQRIYFLLGYNEGLLEHFSIAIQYYDRVRKGMASSEIYYSTLKNRSYCHIRNGNYEDAASDYDTILSNYPNNDLNAEIFLWLANYYLEKSDSRHIRRIVQYFKFREDAESYKAELEYYAGEAFRLDQNFVEAINSFSRSISEGGAFLANAYFGKALSFVAMDKLEEADEEFKNALKNAGENFKLAIDIRTAQASLYYKRGNYMEAGKGYFAIAILYDDPGVVPDALWNAGDCFEKGGEPKRAIQIYEELIERFGKHALADEARKRIKELKT
jgi:TolA-binding protein